MVSRTEGARFMSSTHVSSPFVWKMRDRIEPIPIGRRDALRAVRGILWWVSASVLIWFVAAIVVLSV